MTSLNECLTNTNRVYFVLTIFTKSLTAKLSTATGMLILKLISSSKMSSSKLLIHSNQTCRSLNKA
jgi:hypothetical protein